MSLKNSLKKIYICDICRYEKSSGQLIGCAFPALEKFKLGTADSSNEIHICKDCLKQIKEQLPDVGI